jgi:hypothetical protein
LAKLEQEKQERETQQRFNERMSALDEEYALTDEDREVIASDIKDMDNKDFETYSKKLSVLLSEKNKEVIAKKEAEKQEQEVKASEVVEEKEDAKSIENVVEEAQQEDAEEEGTLSEKYKKAFSIDQFDIDR